MKTLIISITVIALALLVVPLLVAVVLFLAPLYFFFDTIKEIFYLFKKPVISKKKNLSSTTLGTILKAKQLLHGAN